jgi:SAM-dependent methyltransferase
METSGFRRDHQAVVNLAGKALARFRSGGVPAVCRSLVGYVGRRYEQWVDTQLDRKYGLQTGGLHEDLAALGMTGPQAVDANGYEAIQIPKFHAMMRAAGVDPRSHVFVDLGCGKGRALILAGEHGFRRVLGVELSAQLYRLACRNVDAYRRQRQAAPPIAVHCGDAGTYPIPAENVLLFLYNPFRERTMHGVAANIQRAVAAAPGRVVVAYGNPVHHEVLAGRSGLRETGRNRSFAIYR